MLNAINTKLLLAILAALALVSSAVLYQRHESVNAALRAAAILQQQKDAEEQKQRDEVFRRQVQQNRTRHNSASALEGKTWTTYIP